MERMGKQELTEELVEARDRGRAGVRRPGLRPARGVGPQPPSSWPREGHGRGRLGHEGGLVERDAMVFQAARRIAQLDAAHEGLVFGRLDLRRELDPEPRYIGRIGLRDDHRDSLLIDWRAPAAAVFYQATAAEPQRRRTPPGAALDRPHGRRGRGRAARRRGRDRPADRRRGRA